MKKITLYITLLLLGMGSVNAQTALNKARDFYNEGKFSDALPLFEAEYNLKKTNASINHWYGVCLIETGGDLSLAEELLKVGAKSKVRDSFLYLGQMYVQQFRFSDATEMYEQYAKHLKKKGDDDARTKLEELQSESSRLYRMVNHTEDIQIIDSLVVDKNDFLSAYKMSSSTGRLDYYNNILSGEKVLNSTVYLNEKETKIYYSRPAEDGNYTLYTEEKLIDEYKNEKKLSANNFGLSGNANYPFLLTDGVTIYFSAEDERGIGGYDLYISRYNMNSDSYLNPERLNMPFNSTANDYMMAIDDEKGVGWFASDRFQPEGKVCIYTFIPNDLVRIIESEDEKYLASRSQILSIKDTWKKDVDYTDLIATARQEVVLQKKVKRDFEFVVNDKHTYYTLDDFQNSTALDTFQRVLLLHEELKAITAELQTLRHTYSQSKKDDQVRMSSNILTKEKRQEQLLLAIPEWEMKARNMEISSLR